MYVVRPRHIRSTPAALARDLGCQTRFYPNERHPRTFDFRRDFIMMPVNPVQVGNAPYNYADVWAFARKNKYGQRSELSRTGVPVPGTAATHQQADGLAGLQFVVRPLRHSGGVGYRVTSDRHDFRDGAQYVSELYPKRREYRVIFLYGQPLIWMRKKPHEGVPQDAPWGHVNSRFQTINDIAASKIGQTDAVERLRAVPAVASSHIVAADLLWGGREAAQGPYVCLELNFCPALDIENNRAKVVEAIRARL